MVDMDRKLVASEEQYEVAYFAKKHGISAEKAGTLLIEPAEAVKRRTSSQIPRRTDEHRGRSSAVE